jgi:tetratricopeptide (TPR) repeat protein
LKNVYSIFLVLCVLNIQAQKKDASRAQTEEASMKAEMALIDGEKHLILENYAKALEMFRVAREINPRDAAIHFKIAEVLYRNEDYNNAVASAEEAIDLSPENKYYYLLAADIQMARGDLVSAQKIYENLLKRPGNEEYLLDLSFIYQYEGKNQKALDVITRAQDHFGTNETFVLEKQKILTKMGDNAQIILEWERLIKEEPFDESHIFKLSDLLIDLREYDKAEQFLKSIPAGSASANRAGLMLAEILKNQGRLNDAMEFARPSLLSAEIPFDLKGGILNDLLKATKESNREEMLTLVKDVADVHPTEYTAQAFAGDVCFQLEEKKSALKYYLKSTRLIPDNFSIWQNILSLEAEFNMFDSLQVHAEQAIEYFPNQAALYYFGGTAYLRKKNYNRASQLLEIGKRYALDNRLKSVFNGQLGDAYNGLMNYSKSNEAYDEALRLDGDNEHVLNNYSYFLSLRKADLDKALKMSTYLLQIKPDVATYLDTHAWVLFMMGKYKEALKPMQQASVLKPEASILDHYGDVLYKLGETDSAVAAWEKAAEKNPSELILKKIAERKYYE